MNIIEATPNWLPPRFEVAAAVTSHRWAGPFYFNVIRPFHHPVVVGMTKAGARSAPGTRHPAPLKGARHHESPRMPGTP